jgi:SAM-dependent methyltransferase
MTAKSVEVLEFATINNLFPKGYMLANEDLRRAGVDAEAHFTAHGQFEQRKQFTKEIIQPNGYRRLKFSRFAPLINLDSFSSALYPTTFPITLGSKHFRFEDYQQESANGSFGPFVKEIENNPDRNFLDLGCGLRQNVYENCLYVEVYPSISADLIVPPDCTYPLKDEVLDGIGCFAVLEHTRKPWLVAAEMRRMLKPGGKLFIDWPFLQPVHGYPSHYYNSTREGLRALFVDAGFDIIESKTYPFQGPDYTISWVLGKFVRSLPAHRQKEILSMSVDQLLAHLPQGAWWTDLLATIPDEVISEFACGNCLLAVRK